MGILICKLTQQDLSLSSIWLQWVAFRYVIRISNHLQSERNFRRERRENDDDRVAHCCWHFLCWMWINSGVEICKIMRHDRIVIIYVYLFSAVIGFDVFFQETAHEKSQRYKEGKSVLERSVVESYGETKFEFQSNSVR